MRKCCVCGKPVNDGEGYEALGYVYHIHCFPWFPLPVKQRCFFCHKIMRSGDDVASLGDLGCGGQDDICCSKCITKHFGRNKNERGGKKVGGAMRPMFA